MPAHGSLGTCGVMPPVSSRTLYWARGAARAHMPARPSALQPERQPARWVMLFTATAAEGLPSCPHTPHLQATACARARARTLTTSCAPQATSASGERGPLLHVLFFYMFCIATTVLPLFMPATAAPFSACLLESCQHERWREGGSISRAFLPLGPRCWDARRPLGFRVKLSKAAERHPIPLLAA